jgi:hypothetical protein
MLQRQQHWGSSSAAEQCGIWRGRLHAMLQNLRAAEDMHNSDKGGISIGCNNSSTWQVGKVQHEQCCIWRGKLYTPLHHLRGRTEMCNSEDGDINTDGMVWVEKQVPYSCT